MTSFSLQNTDTAPQASQPLLAAAEKAYGFLPNLLRGMAASPALLEGYMTLAGIFDKTNLTETERQIILMTSNRLNGCTYCMAAHSAISLGAGVPADVVSALRSGESIDDARLEALRQFTVKVVESRGWPTEEDVLGLLAAGYTTQTVLDVVLGTSLKVMSNYTNHIVQTPLDPVFEAHAWSPVR
ncbi:MAG: carboxymuconolactone decarboxylase family protein [Pelomonas sp.]|nr:carboxymuconolactone decarboxylase family protein [Roseateles sp.]